MKRFSQGYSGERRPPKQLKREGWWESGALMIAANDERLTWPERSLERHLGENLCVDGRQPRETPCGCLDT
jgi:hypothetical protein